MYHRYYKLIWFVEYKWILLMMTLFLKNITIQYFLSHCRFIGLQDIGYRTLQGFSASSGAMAFRYTTEKVHSSKTYIAQKDLLCSMAHPSNFKFHDAKQDTPTKYAVQSSQGSTSCSSWLTQEQGHGSHIIYCKNLTTGAKQVSLCNMMVHPTKFIMLDAK